MKSLTFQELAEMEAVALRDYGVRVILKTKRTFGQVTFWRIRETKAVFSKHYCGGWICPNISTYGKTWVVYLKETKKQ